MIICPYMFIHGNGVNGDINALRIDLISIYDDICLYNRLPKSKGLNYELQILSLSSHVNYDTNLTTIYILDMKNIIE